MMTLRRAAALLACLLVTACGSPKDAEGWAKRAASRSRTDEKLEALAQVRKAPGDRRAAVPYLVEVLKQAPRARGEAAMALGEIGDPAAVKPLLDAVDRAAQDRDTRDANRHIATALGALRAREAVPALVELTASPDGYTQVAAVDALGEIGDPAAIDTLVRIATSTEVEPFTAKRAILALGRIGDARAGPVVLRMLFEERPGVTFFPEAAFAAAQIGRPMAAPLLAVLEGKDAALQDWARTRGVVSGALYAKAAQVLGDVGGPDAVPALVARLTYRDPDPRVGVYVRVFAAESLGRLRAREAVKPLADLVAREPDPDARDRYCEALARIGDPAALPALRAAAAAGAWRVREAPLAALSRLGGAPEAAVVEEAIRACGNGCPAQEGEALAGMKARLAAAAACQDAACWAGKLADPDPAVRDRAALEVGRAGGAAHARALADAIARPVDGDAAVAARHAAVLGLGWIAAREPLGADAAQVAAAIDRTVAQDRGRTLTAGVNEDALRLALRLKRTAAK
ncbi:PBS lyase HEAT domain protein repeat-containing protein [Anaeromyxobacter dehalogenans 2CP-1]|uniref:PBS lyase HEAT domain protein repeat-containing protein n=1 Tax=Anaeromyxobacter dehalogenans (strain ATCC BAA-258 / DSM 21875 / 2CP-1) TaxID=455488 RepID=B8J9P0_ANAD2|nr:HEAT repeat domain-containing protein [Anaeromyxobacter dehalogenans]ACL67428.1 PBS lyase HEAT domain protein repeat-containing protein [Anaeromyxobacter dehalogenans 2CP-1]